MKTICCCWGASLSTLSRLRFRKVDVEGLAFEREGDAWGALGACLLSPYPGQASQPQQRKKNTCRRVLSTIIHIAGKKNHPRISVPKRRRKSCPTVGKAGPQHSMELGKTSLGIDDILHVWKVDGRFVWDKKHGKGSTSRSLCFWKEYYFFVRRTLLIHTPSSNERIANFEYNSCAGLFCLTSCTKWREAGLFLSGFSFL